LSKTAVELHEIGEGRATENETSELIKEQGVTTQRVGDPGEPPFLANSFHSQVSIRDCVYPSKESNQEGQSPELEYNPDKGMSHLQR